MVILSVVTASHSEAVTESKDPYPLNSARTRQGILLKQRRAQAKGASAAEGICLIHDHRRLPRNLKPLAAAHVLAGHHVVFPHHIRTELGEARAVTLVGASGNLALLGADHPGNFILRRLVAMWTVQRSCFLLLPLIKKISLFHTCGAPTWRRSISVKLLHICKLLIL